MTALADTIEAALRDAQAPTTSLRWYAETAARAVEPLIRAAEAAALERARDAIADYPSAAPNEAQAAHYDQQIDHSQIIIDSLPRDGSALDAVVAARTAGAIAALTPAQHATALHMAVLSEFMREEGWGKPLRALTLDGQISIDMARAICRDLAGNGLAEHLRGLWHEDGGPAGTGYGITRKGIALLDPAP